MSDEAHFRAVRFFVLQRAFNYSFEVLKLHFLAEIKKFLAVLRQIVADLDDEVAQIGEHLRPGVLHQRHAAVRVDEHLERPA